MLKVGLGEVKVNIQTSGICVSDALLQKLIFKFNFPHVSYKKILLYFYDSEGDKHPVYTYLTDSPKAFRLFLDKDGQLYLVKGVYYIKVYLSPRPFFYDININGKLGYSIANIETEGHMAVTLNHFCIHFYNKKQCQFCSIESWADNNKRNLDDLLEIIKLAFTFKFIEHISLTTGTLPRNDKGIKDFLRFIELLDRERITVPVACEFEPVEDLNWIKKLYDYNVKTVSCNIEILEENLRKKLMPAKGNIPKKLYYKNWDKCVELFGKNQVYSNVLLNKYNTDCNENVKEIALMTDIGVIPSLGLLYPEKNTALCGLEMADQDFQMIIHMENLHYLVTNNLNPLLAKAGCPRNGSYSAIKEFYLDYSDRRRNVIYEYKISS